MTISLQKGQKISLAKAAPDISAALVGLGWDVNPTDTGTDFDLDVSLFLLDTNDKLVSQKHFIFYNNLTSPDADKSVEHTGDNLTGDGDGDDEVININLAKIPSDVQKIVVVVTIHEAEQRGQNFGQVDNAYVRIVDAKTNSEATRFDLTEDCSIETAMIMAEIYRKNGEWRVNAVGAGYQGGLQALLDRYQS